MNRIGLRYWIGIFCVFVLATGILVAMQRPIICTCGEVKLWEAVVNGPGNSQHLSDWYSFSHIIHGFLFYAAGSFVLGQTPIGLRLLLASVLELAWEILENSPLIIDRYRAQTMAVGYSGDSIVNSVSDGGMMMLGFLLASRLPWKATALLAVAFELFTLAAVRDNLTLNILMLIHPSEDIRSWQAGG